MNQSNDNNMSIFKEIFRGKLYYLEEKEIFLARIRYDYEKIVMKELLEGDFIFILNFNTDNTYNCYTMLKIISLYPKHYALEAVKGVGYPGFLKDVMQNIEEDWELEGSVETYVDCIAIPMGYDIISDKKDLDLLDVKKKISKPIPGKDIKMLGDKYLQKFFSWGLDIKNSICIGDYLANKKIEINIALDRMVRRHFGVFASTGSGKSNFIAQLIRLTSQQYLVKTNREIKIIIFDVQGEYSALTSDILYHSGLLILSEAESSSILEDYFKGSIDAKIIESCSEILSQQIKKPGIFETQNDPFKKVFIKMLNEQRIKKISSETGFMAAQTVEDFLKIVNPGTSSEWRARAYKEFTYKVVKERLTGDITDEIITKLKEIANEVQNMENFSSGQGKQYSGAFFYDLNSYFQSLELLSRKGQASEFTVTDLIFDYILEQGNKDSNPNVIIISISDQDQMSNIARRIVDTCLSTRRKNPNFHFDILFVFDEAHEFISTAPQEQTENVKNSRRSLLKLARQGRKYGLGMCIATQRTRYLDTTIMGQMHTLFAGFLPRKTDREPLIDAFNIEEDVIRESKNFGPGQWLICSATATGIFQSVPISFKAKNCEEILKAFFTYKGWTTS